MPQDPASDSDRQLAERVLAGDSEAFGEIIVRHEASLRRIVIGIVADVHFAEDVLQDVFLLAYQKLPTFRFEAPLFAWLKRIAIREAISAHSKWKKRWRKFLPLAETCEETLPDPGGAQDSPLESLEEALVLLKSLPPAQRTAFVLYAEGWSYEEICATLDCPMGTVSTWLHRAKDRLQKWAKARERLADSPAVRSKVNG